MMSEILIDIVDTHGLKNGCPEINISGSDRPQSGKKYQTLQVCYECVFEYNFDWQNIAA